MSFFLSSLYESKESHEKGKLSDISMISEVDDCMANIRFPTGSPVKTDSLES